MMSEDIIVPKEIDYKEFKKLEKKGFNFEWNFNDRPDRDIIVKYLKKFSFAMVDLDAESINVIYGIVPIDDLKTLKKWISFTFKNLHGYNITEFSSKTGKFRFEWE
jgi:hypothetical protein